MVTFLTCLSVFMWLVIGAVLAFMAGTTHKPSVPAPILFILGPIGIPVWMLADKIKGK